MGPVGDELRRPPGLVRRWYAKQTWLSGRDVALHSTHRGSLGPRAAWDQPSGRAAAADLLSREIARRTFPDVDGAVNLVRDDGLRNSRLLGAARLLRQVGVVRVLAGFHRLVGGVIATDDAGGSGDPGLDGAELHGGRTAGFVAH